MVEMRDGLDFTIREGLIKSLILPVFVFRPHRVQKPAGQRLQSSLQLRCILIAPGIEIVGEPACLGRIRVDKIARPNFVKNAIPVCAHKLPLLAAHPVREMAYLIADLRNLGSAEPFPFAAQGRIELSLLVEPHEAIEA